MSVTRKYGLKFVAGGTKTDTDRRFRLPRVGPNLPSEFSLQNEMPPVWDQGDKNCCTAEAATAAYQHRMKLENLPPFDASKLFLYYNERLLEGDPDKDDGATVRDSMVALQQYGNVPEDLFPFDDADVFTKPSPSDYATAAKRKVVSFKAVDQNETAIKTAIFSHNPICFGILVYDSFETDSVAQTGMVPMPNKQFDRELGGHAVVIVGWNDSLRCFIVRNSWGENWGRDGYFFLPYDYVLDPTLSSEFWIITDQD